MKQLLTSSAAGPCWCAGGERAKAPSQAQPSQEQQQQAQTQQSQQDLQQAKHRTRKAKPKVPGVPYSLQLAQQEHAGSGGVGAAGYASQGEAGDQYDTTDSDGDWQASQGSKSRKRRRSSRAAPSRKKQQQMHDADDADAAADAAGDWYAGCAVDPSSYYAAMAAAAAGGGQYAEGVYNMAGYGAVIAAAAAAGAADAVGTAAMQLPAWQWPQSAADGAATAAAAAGAALTPHLDAGADQGFWPVFKLQSQSPSIPRHADNPGTVHKGRATPGLFAAGSPGGPGLAAATAAAAAGGGSGGSSGGASRRKRKGRSIARRGDAADAARVADAAAGAEALDASLGVDAEALQAAEALASLDNSRSSSLPFNSPSSASSRRPPLSSMAAAAAAGALMCQPDYSQQYPAAAVSQEPSVAHGQQQRAWDGQATLQLNGLCAGQQQAAHGFDSQVAAVSGSAGMAEAAASRSLPGAAAAAAGAGGNVGGNELQGLQRQDPHINSQQWQQQLGSSGSAERGSAKASGGQTGVSAQVAELGDSWALNMSSPLPAMMLQMPQQGSECSLRDMMQERYSSSGALTAAAAASGCTPLENSCGGDAGGESAPSASAAGAAAAAASVAERRSRRSRLADAQPGLQQLLATPNALMAGLLAIPAAATGAAGRVSLGVPEACSMQGDYVSCFPALTPGGWNAAEGAVSGSAPGTQDQQQVTPSNILISTQLGDGAFSVLQHLQTLLDSQQRSRGSGSGSSRNSNHLRPQAEGGVPAAAAEEQQQQGHVVQRGETRVALTGGTQQDESPASPDDGLLQQGQQVLGCLLNTPYPLLYRTTNACGAHADQQHQQQQQDQQRQAVAGSASEDDSGADHAADAVGNRSQAQDSGTRCCDYKSAAAAIEDAAQQCSGPMLHAAAMALAAAAQAAAAGGGRQCGLNVAANGAVGHNHSTRSSATPASVVDTAAQST